MISAAAPIIKGARFMGLLRYILAFLDRVDER